MFNMNSIIKEVNILNKLVCYFFLLIAALVIKDPIFMVFVNLFLLMITKSYDNLFKINMFTLLIAVISMFYPQYLWITKLGCLVIYTLLLKKVTKGIELRYVLESTLYRFQQKKITYRVLYFIYFWKYYKNNFQKLLVLKDDYGLKYSFSLIVFILKNSYQKTKIQMKEFLEINKLRFYNDSNQRTYMEQSTWESWDTNYLVIHIMIFVIACFYGR